ncbi:hypothetical protein VP01_8507g2, partial [Puccinia sorghi]
PPNAPDNKFPWKLAQKSFTELLRCGEYKVDFQLQDPQIMSQEIETLSRRNTFGPKASNAIMPRPQNGIALVEQRLAVARQFEGLEDLVPAIKAACSDDETDHEEAPKRILRQGRKH